GLCSALSKQGHEVSFFERDVPYYARHRDLIWPESYKLILYPNWADTLLLAKTAIREADVAMVTSYCPDARQASDLILDSSAIKVYYDLDTAITLEKLRSSGSVEYVPKHGLSGFDLVLSYVGGDALTDLQQLLGAKRV